MKTARYFAIALLAGNASCVVCDEYKQKADALVEEYASCSDGDTCVAIDLQMRNTCIPAFACVVSINSNMDSDEFKSKAAEINDGNGDSCGAVSCDLSSCEIGVQEPYCDSATGRCRVALKTEDGGL